MQKVNDAHNAIVDLLQEAAMRRIQQQSQVRPAPFEVIRGAVGNIQPKPKKAHKPKDKKEGEK